MCHPTSVRMQNQRENKVLLGAIDSLIVEILKAGLPVLLDRLGTDKAVRIRGRRENLHGGGGSGCIHDEAGTDGEKSIGWGVVFDSRKYGEESWWVKEVSRRG